MGITKHIEFNCARSDQSLADLSTEEKPDERKTSVEAAGREWDGTGRGDHFAPLIAFRGNQTKSGFGLLFS